MEESRRRCDGCGKLTPLEDGAQDMRVAPCGWVRVGLADFGWPSEVWADLCPACQELPVKELVGRLEKRLDIDVEESVAALNQSWPGPEKKDA